MSQQDTSLHVLCASFTHWPCNPEDPEAALSSMLPRAYLQKGINVRVILPAGPLVKALLEDVHRISTLHLVGTTEPVGLWVGQTLQGLSVYLVELLGGEQANARVGKSTTALTNYALFSRAVAAVAMDKADLEWRSNIVHHNDWETGLVSALLSTDDAANIKTVFTLPEGDQLGYVDEHIYKTFYLPPELLTEEGVLWNGELSFLKAATTYADELVLRSPNLFKEVNAALSQNKLAYLLQNRKGPIRSYLHGVNHLLWNPATDPHTVQQYDAASVNLKKINKLRLQQRLKLEEDESVLLLGYCGPVTQISGISHILNTLPDLWHESKIKLVIQAWGDKESVEHLLNQQSTYPELLTVLLGKNEELYHQVIAGADCLLLPSLFPTSGENVVVALTYGTVPIATSCGAHMDYIVDTNSRTSLNGTATGFLYPVDRPSALLDTINRVKRFRDKPGVWWEKLANNGMNHTFTGEATADSYIDLYEKLIADDAL